MARSAAAGQVEFPPAVYVPTVEDENGRIRLDMRVTRDGRTALLVYSALDRLERWFGPSPWALVRSSELEALHAETPFDLLFLDKSIVPEDPADRSEAAR